MVEAFIKFNRNKPNNYGKTHHEVMTAFIGDMASSLSEYGSSNGYSIPFTYYKDLSWAGLLGTPTFKFLYPQYLNSTDATNNPQNRNPNFIRVNNVIASEQNNSKLIYTFPNGTTYTSNPKGRQVGNSNSCN
ncbi:hypothetical protein [Flavimarina sp. Hel_I_48]|uniref:hypothetical protein n=1 Tax=Flavimarina sp. Hel_I_48 TaxID=1392488 RepID=UPI0004DFACC8|nr:hypothetical protein [Flavimarina sp. Hel_I_48]